MELTQTSLKAWQQIIDKVEATVEGQEDAILIMSERVALFDETKTEKIASIMYLKAISNALQQESDLLLEGMSESNRVVVRDMIALANKKHKTVDIYK